MKLSSLQKHILTMAWENRKARVSRDKFNAFYKILKKAPAKKLQIKIISRSLERLIEKGLLIGFGEKTQHKLYIHQVQLTAAGKKTALTLLNRQVSLPFKKKKVANPL